MAAFVVGWNCNVDEFGWGIGVAEGDNGNVDIGSLFDGLGVGTWIRYNDETRLLERASDVVREISRSEATGNCNGSGVSGEFEHSALSIGACGDDSNVGRIIDRSDYPGCEDDFFPVRSVELA